MPDWVAGDPYYLAVWYIAEACWAGDPRIRPKIEELLELLDPGMSLDAVSAWLRRRETPANSECSAARLTVTTDYSTSFLVEDIAHETRVSELRRGSPPTRRAST